MAPKTDKKSFRKGDRVYSSSWGLATVTDAVRRKDDDGDQYITVMPDNPKWAHLPPNRRKAWVHLTYKVSPLKDALFQALEKSTADQRLKEFVRSRANWKGDEKHNAMMAVAELRLLAMQIEDSVNAR